MVGGAITVPERGTLIDDSELQNLVALTVRENTTQQPNLGTFPRGIIVH